MTIACSGHPWAISVTTRLTVSAEVRRRYNAVPFVAVNVFRHSVQRKLCSLREWMPIFPWPVCPLAGHARWGQNIVAGSMRILLSWRCWGACQEGVCLDPHFCYKCTSPRFSGELPPRRPCRKNRPNLPLCLFIWKFFSIIAKIRVLYAENFGIIAHGRQRPEDGFQVSRLNSPL